MSDYMDKPFNPGDKVYHVGGRREKIYTVNDCRYDAAFNRFLIRVCEYMDVGYSSAEYFRLDKPSDFDNGDL